MQYEYHGHDELEELKSNISSLCSLSRTCKTFRGLAQPILHHNFPMQTWEQHPACLYLFARTITGRPDLANATRVIELHLRGLQQSPEPSKPSGSWLETPTEAEDVGQIEEAVRRLSLATLKGWSFEPDPWGPYGETPALADHERRIRLDFTTCSLLAWLTLCLCTSAKIIDFGPYLYSYGDWAEWSGISQLPSPLGTECVRVHGEFWPGQRNRIGCVGRGGDMRHLADMTDYLANIKTLQLRFCCFPYDCGDQVDADAAVWHPPPTPAETLRSLDLSSLSSLNLLLCELSKDRLIQLLEKCITLTEFSYIGLANLQPDHPSTSPRVEPGEVTDMIQHRLHHLRGIHLRLLVLENFVAPGSISERPTGLFSSPAANHTPRKALPAILPRSIEHLYIFEAREWDDEVSEALIHPLKTILKGEASFNKFLTISVSCGPRWNWLEYMSRSGEKMLGSLWWWAVQSPYAPELFPELDPRVAELAEEAGIKLDVEIKLEKRKAAEADSD